MSHSLGGSMVHVIAMPS